MSANNNTNPKNNSRPDDVPANIHDQFFRFALSKPQALKGLLNAFFPQYASDIDFATLRKLPDSYTNKKLRQFFSDVVYIAKLKNGLHVKITILLEHKSYIDNSVQRQVNQYILNLWNSEQKQKIQFSIPLPIVIYTGSKSWKPQTIKEYFQQKGVEQKYLEFIPDFKLLFISIRDLKDEEILKLNTDATLFFWALVSKYINEHPQQLLKTLRILSSYIKEMFEARDIVESLEVVLHYISYFRKFAEEDIKEEIMEVFTGVEPLPNSLYMELLTKGEQLGLKRGKLEDAYNLYKLGIPMEIIVKATGLKEEEIWQYIKERDKK